MKLFNIYKNIPKNIFAILKSFTNLRHISSIVSSSKNFEIHLLGNGPSLTESLSTINIQGLILNVDYGCVNSFSSTCFYEKIKPTHYFLFDPAYWDDLSSNDVRESVKDTYEAIINKTTWSLFLYIPKTAKGSKILINLNLNKNITVVYCNTSPTNASSLLKHILYKYNLAMVHVQNVLVAAIFISINMGYKKIVIHGADHSWIENIEVNQENVVCIKDSHFYDDKPVSMKPWFKSANSVFRMHELLQVLAKKFAGYWALSDYAKKREVKIINASKKTYIDAFDRN